MASGVVGSLLVKLGAVTAEFDRAMDKSAGRVRQFENTVGKSAMGTAIGIGMAKGVQLLGNAARNAVSGLIQLAKEMDHVVEAADKIGIDTKSFLYLDVIAQESAISIESVGKAIETMRTNIAKGKGFQQLGFTEEELKKLGSGKAFEAIAQKIAAIQDPMERTRIQMELFGKQGKDMDGVIRNLAGGYGAWADQVADPKAAEALARLGDAMEMLGRKVKKVAIGFFGNIGIAIENLNKLDEELAKGNDVGNFERFAAAFELFAAIFGHDVKEHPLVSRARQVKNEIGAIANDPDMKDAMKVLDQLKEKVDSFGESNTETMRRKFIDALPGSGADKGNDKLLQQFDMLAEEYDRRTEEEKAFKELVDETNKAIEEELNQYDRVIERGIELAKHADPLAEYADKMKNLRAALEGGALTKGEFEATVKVERDKTSKELAGEFKPADLVPALIMGTKEAYMAIARSSNNPQLREAQKQTMELKEIKKKLDFAEAKP